METMDWIPEICYEDSEDGMTSHIPFIQVPDNRSMPTILFIFASTDTGESEPGPEGEDLPVTEIELHQYADMNTLRDKLSSDMYNTVRVSLGLEPLDTAVEKGKKITDAIRSKIL
jgi:hypothetical protein